jgi:hypothetical protein
MPARTEWPLSELDAALDRYGQLAQNLGHNIATNNAIRDGYIRGNTKPTAQLRREISKQKNVVRRIAAISPSAAHISFRPVTVSA